MSRSDVNMFCSNLLVLLSPVWCCRHVHLSVEGAVHSQEGEEVCCAVNGASLVLAPVQPVRTALRMTGTGHTRVRMLARVC